MRRQTIAVFKSRTGFKAVLSRFFTLGLLTLITCGPRESIAQNKEEEKQRVLTQMETVAQNFHSFSAKISLKRYIAVLKEFDDTPSSGEFILGRAKNGNTLLRLEISSPGKYILTIKDGIATNYQPDIKEAQILSLGKDKDKAEYMALGIGQSPKRLEETYDITYQGSELINQIPCSILILKPKNNKNSSYSLITWWISKTKGIPVQQKLQEPSRDYTLVNFTDEKINPKISNSLFEQKLPKSVKRRIQ